MINGSLSGLSAAYHSQGQVFRAGRGKLGRKYKRGGGTEEWFQPSDGFGMWALLLPSVYCAAEGRLILRNGDGLTEKTERDSKERDKETQQRKGTKRFN